MRLSHSKKRTSHVSKNPPHPWVCPSPSGEFSFTQALLTSSYSCNYARPIMNCKWCTWHHFIKKSKHLKILELFATLSVTRMFMNTLSLITYPYATLVCTTLASQPLQHNSFHAPSHLATYFHSVACTASKTHPSCQSCNSRLPPSPSATTTPSCPSTLSCTCPNPD